MVTLLMTSRDPMTHSGDVITFKILLLSEFFLSELEDLLT